LSIVKKAKISIKKKVKFKDELLEEEIN